MEERKIKKKETEHSILEIKKQKGDFPQTLTLKKRYQCIFVSMVNKLNHNRNKMVNKN